MTDPAALEIPNSVLAEVLLTQPALWDATIFGQEVPDFHAHLWDFLVDEDIQYLCIELPGGHAKSALISGKYPIYRLCKDPNDRICIMQKGIQQAKDVVAAMQRELQHNKVLNDLYGPFKPESSSGYPWSTTTFRIAGNTDRGEQTNSVSAYGWSSTDIMGNRFKAFLGDDFVTADNSDTPEKRERISNKETTEWDKTLIGTPKPRYILMGTPMFYGDAFESKRKLTPDGNYLGPDDWRTPDEIEDKGQWVFIRRSAEQGKTKGKTLWPHQADWPFLKQEKQKGYVNYLRRLCCQVSEPGMAIFKEKAIRGGFEEETGNHYPGCLDYDRKLGDYPSGLKIVTAADPASGKKTGASAQFAHVVIGFDKSNDTIYLIDFMTAPIPATRGGAPVDGESQVGTIIHRHHKYGATVSIIEDNGQQWAWLDMVREKDRTVRVKPHHTGKKKHDKDVGVDGMAGYFESGRIRIPYAASDPETQKIMDELITQLIRYPFGDFTDGVMALWFAVFNVRKRGEVKFLDYHEFRRSATQLIKKG